MHCLVIGKTGQLARALQAEIAADHFSATFLDRSDCDLASPEALLRECLQPHLDQGDIIIIAAAYTAVDQAETDFETAYRVNAVAPGIIAELAARADIPVIHISTDYVFDGQARKPYATDAPVAPVNAYGRTKLAGEEAVRTAQPRAAILRTSWVYDVSGRNFLTTMLRLGASCEMLDIVADQTGRPTHARDLARACMVVAKALCANDPAASAIFHISNSGQPTSWAGFARAIFSATSSWRDHAVSVRDIATADFPTPARRPAYSVLDLEPFETTFDFAMPDWQVSLHRALQNHPMIVAGKTRADDDT